MSQCRNFCLTASLCSCFFLNILTGYIYSFPKFILHPKASQRAYSGSYQYIGKTQKIFLHFPPTNLQAKEEKVRQFLFTELPSHPVNLCRLSRVEEGQSKSSAQLFSCALSDIVGGGGEERQKREEDGGIMLP